MNVPDYTTELLDCLRSPVVEISMLSGIASQMVYQSEEFERGIRSGSMDPGELRKSHRDRIKQANDDFHNAFTDMSSALYILFTTLLEMKSACKVGDDE